MKKLEHDYNMKRENSENPNEVLMPNVMFSSANYEVTGAKATASSIVGYIRMFCIVLCFMGDSLW